VHEKVTALFNSSEVEPTATRLVLVNKNVCIVMLYFAFFTKQYILQFNSLQTLTKYLVTLKQ